MGGGQRLKSGADRGGPGRPGYPGGGLSLQRIHILCQFPGMGLTCARDEADVEALYQDIIHASHGCLNPGAGAPDGRGIPTGLRGTEGYGLEFTNSKDIGMVSCFGKTARGGVLNDLNQAVDAYQEQIEARPKLKVVSGITAFTLVMKEGACRGVIGFQKDGEITVLLASATVLACGGGENLYQYSYAVGPLNGSAYAMAARMARES